MSAHSDTSTTPLSQGATLGLKVTSGRMRRKPSSPISQGKVGAGPLATLSHSD